MLKPKYGNKTKLAYTDTDRFVIHIETENVIKDFREIDEANHFFTHHLDELMETIGRYLAEAEPDMIEQTEDRA